MKAVSKALFAIFCYGVSIAMLAQPAESAPISEVATVDGFNGFEQAHTSLYRRMEQSGDSTPTSSNFPSHLDREPIASRTRSKTSEAEQVKKQYREELSDKEVQDMMELKADCARIDSLLKEKKNLDADGAIAHALERIDTLNQLCLKPVTHHPSDDSSSSSARRPLPAQRKKT